MHLSMIFSHVYVYLCVSECVSVCANIRGTLFPNESIDFERFVTLNAILNSCVTLKSRKYVNVNIKIILNEYEAIQY